MGETQNPEPRQFAYSQYSPSGSITMGETENPGPRPLAPSDSRTMGGNRKLSALTKPKPSNPE